MKFSRNILSEFVDVSDISNIDFYNALNDLGLEVESIIDIKLPDDVVIGKVVDKIKHADADKLSVCRVDIGNKILQIVCGAKNVQINQIVCVALEGAKIGSITIKKSKLRGVVSEGMLCSSIELGLKKIDDGILVLDNSIGEIVLGKQLNEYPIFNDTIFEVNITPNRGDCLSVIGIARDLSVLFNLDLINIKENEHSSDVIPGIGRVFNISFDDNLHSSLYYKVAKIQNLNNNFKLKFYLSLSDSLGSDPLNNIVTFSTYMTGVIINAYGVKYISDDIKIQFHISVDSNGLESVFYNGNRLYDIGISTNKDFIANEANSFVIFESSYIPPDYVSKLIFNNDYIGDDNITYMSKRGSSPLLENGMYFLCNLLQDTSSSVIYSSSQHILQNFHRPKIDTYLDEIRLIIGDGSIDNQKIINLLKKMDFNISKTSDDNLIITSPPIYRHDIKNIQDISEEILRIKGIDAIPSYPQYFKQYKNMDINFDKYKFKRMIAKNAIANNFFECIHYLFAKKNTMKIYRYPILKDNLDISNPITSDLDTLRTSLIPSMIDSVINNINRGHNSIALFEIGSIYDVDRNESDSLAFVVNGNTINPRYPTPKPSKWNFYNFASVISNIIGKFDLDMEHVMDVYHPGISANIIMDGKSIGTIGKLHPNIVTKLSQDIDCFICEIDINKLFSLYIRPIYKETSKYQVSQRDITVLVDSNIPFKDIRSKILDLNIKYIKSIIPLDVYKSNDFGGKISLSFRILFQSMDKTLIDEDLKLDSIVKLLLDNFGAILR